MNPGNRAANSRTNLCEYSSCHPNQEPSKFVLKTEGIDSLDEDECVTLVSLTEQVQSTLPINVIYNHRNSSLVFTVNSTLSSIFRGITILVFPMPRVCLVSVPYIAANEYRTPEYQYQGQIRIRTNFGQKSADGHFPSGQNWPREAKQPDQKSGQRA